MPAVIPFVQGVAAGFAGSAVIGGSVATAGFLSGVSAAALVSSSVFGSLILNVGLNLAIGALLKPSGPKSQAPSIDDAQVNSRIPTAVRWMAGGTAALGGAAGMLGEFDEDGHFWYIIAHGDTELTGDPTYYLDDIEVTLSDGTDGFTAGDVVTDEFCLTDAFEQYEGTGTKVPYFRLYTVTPDSANDYGAVPAALSSAIPLPSNFRGVGVCYTVIRCKAILPQHRAKAYKYRGPIGIGEPNVRVVASFSRMYDPREAGHDIDDATTWTATDGNSAIVWAWFRTHSRGRNRPVSEINWGKVEEAANRCDETVIDRNLNSIPRYRCGIAAPDNKPRHQVEGEILLSCDGFVAEDDAGQAYPVVGVYNAPTLGFTAARDILDAETVAIRDGEAQLDGVIVNYISPDHKYTKQPCAPWVNSIYYDGTTEPNYQAIDILTCQDHNQAVRLAKAIGLRTAATKKAGLITTVKGVLARGVRTIDLDWDSDFVGDYEIVTPVQESEDGTATSFAVVPMQTGRYDLEEGEEGAPPAPTPALGIDTSLEVAQNVAITIETIAVAGGAAIRIFATFDAPARVDRVFQFRYTKSGETAYEYFAVNMEETKAFSGIVIDGQDYDVQWQTVTAGGRASGWAADIGGGETVYVVSATANLVTHLGAIVTEGGDQVTST